MQSLIRAAMLVGHKSCPDAVMGAVLAQESFSQRARNQRNRAETHRYVDQCPIDFLGEGVVTPVYFHCLHQTHTSPLI